MAWIKTGATCPGCGREMEVNAKNSEEFRHADTGKKNC